MPQKPPKQVVAVRLDPDLAAWSISGGDRTALVESLLMAYRDRRLVIYAEPAPDVVNDGSDSGRPALVAWNSQIGDRR